MMLNATTNIPKKTQSTDLDITRNWHVGALQDTAAILLIQEDMENCI